MKLRLRFDRTPGAAPASTAGRPVGSANRILVLHELQFESELPMSEHRGAVGPGGEQRWSRLHGLQPHVTL